MYLRYYQFNYVKGSVLIAAINRDSARQQLVEAGFPDQWGIEISYQQYQECRKTLTILEKPETPVEIELIIQQINNCLTGLKLDQYVQDVYEFQGQMRVLLKDRALIYVGDCPSIQALEMWGEDYSELYKIYRAVQLTLEAVEALLSR